MKCVVPLAGPDLYSGKFGLRPLYNWEGRPLIEAVLDSRPWRGVLSPDDYIFIVREVEPLSQLTHFLRSRWPGCAIITLSRLTEGALFSCLAGMALVPPDEALIVDLADIYFETGPSEPLTLFREGYKAVVPVFESSEAHYSYLLYEEGAFKMAAEKQVISNLASAGVYMFSSSKTFVDCAGWSIENRDKVSWANNLFICPMINALVHEKKSVTSPFLEKVRPVGKIFHL